MIEKKTEALARPLPALRSVPMRQSAPAAGGPGRTELRAAGEASAAVRRRRGAQSKAEENVVDAEFEEVRDKGRRASS
jgi:hypothetical protein